MTASPWAAQRNVYNLRVNQWANSWLEKVSQNMERNDTMILSMRERLGQIWRVDPDSTSCLPIVCQPREHASTASSNSGTGTLYQPCFSDAFSAIFLSTSASGKHWQKTAKQKRGSRDSQQPSASLQGQKTAPAPAASFIRPPQGHQH